jgi:MoaA/NifB/PqqE/SkfB family radical SAM enzyme
MPPIVPKSSIVPHDLLLGWWKILNGRIPLLSIEITRECPLSCPGCYAYGDSHLGGETTLRQLNDLRGEALVNGIMGLVKQHRPLQVSLVGGEPMMRRRELDRIIPMLSEMGIFVMLVTSGVIPIPEHWMSVPRFRVAVSIDGLPEHHDIRRKPATYERILKNIAGREINVHWVITKPMLNREGYLEDYVRFWNERPEVNHIWVSLYTPQMGEQSAEMLTPEDRERIARELPALRENYPKFLINKGITDAFISPPKNPQQCLFAGMSKNYSADLRTQVEPCVFGGTPDCSQCGCAMSSALHWIRDIKVAGPVKIDHLVRASLAVGRVAGKLRPESSQHQRWESFAADESSELVQIQT